MLRNLNNMINTLKGFVPPPVWRMLGSLKYRTDKYIREKHRRYNMRERVRRQKRKNYQEHRILAIYDFIDLPFSFDISTFLINAELERRKKGCDKIDIVFVCHASDPGPPRHPYVNKDNFRHYLHNLGLEITRLFDLVGSIYVFDNRRLFMDFFARFKREYFVFPQDYKSSLPLEIRSDRPAVHERINSAQAVAADPSLLCLRAPEEQVAVVRKWILKHVYPKVPVTITLREWDWWAPKRNSNIPEWQKLIDYYHDSEIAFIILRDYYKLYEAPVLSGQNVIYYNEPVILLSLRAALYQECSLNLFVSNGCMEMARFNRTSRYIIFKTTADDRAARPEELWLHQGLRPGEDVQGSTKYQKLVWEVDNFETMKSHVDKMLETFRADGVLIPKYYGKFERDEKTKVEKDKRKK